MSALLSLWLPILLSAAVVFVISSLVHMVFKWHASDYNGFANEDALRAVILTGNPKRGRYVVPFCKDMKDMAGDAMKTKYAEGPIGHFTLGRAGMPNIGSYLGQWFRMCVEVSAFAALLAGLSIARDPLAATAAARLVGLFCFAAYGFGTITESIWSMRPWGSSAKYLLDAALYALGSAAVFYWLWR